MKPWHIALLLAGILGFFTCACGGLTIAGWRWAAAFLNAGEGVEGIALEVDSPARVALGTEFAIEMRVHNSATYPQTLDSIDVYKTYLDGISLKKVTPEHDAMEDYGSFVSYAYGNRISIPPNESLRIRFLAEAMAVGEFTQL